jgi:flagellar motor switch/type III secretory pathway protein FliN
MDDFKLSSFDDYDDLDKNVRKHLDLESIDHNIDDSDTDYLNNDLDDNINYHQDTVTDVINNLDVDNIINVGNKLPDLEEIKLVIRCDIGEIMLSLDQIMNLSHGTILNLDSLPPKVILSLNNRQIARGVLIELNGRLGVRIVEKSL